MERCDARKTYHFSEEVVKNGADDLVVSDGVWAASCRGSFRGNCRANCLEQEHPEDAVSVITGSRVQIARSMMMYFRAFRLWMYVN